MEGHRSGDISRLQNDPIFPISGVLPKYNEVFSCSNRINGICIRNLHRRIKCKYHCYDNLNFVAIPHLEVDSNLTLKAQQNPGLLI
jgi:hypothetical protein